jgi:hypothetical protein
MTAAASDFEDIRILRLLWLPISPLGHSQDCIARIPISRCKSHRHDLHWLSKSGKCQNDWTLFSRDDFVESN